MRAEDVEIFENIGAEKLDEGEGFET